MNQQVTDYIQKIEKDWQVHTCNRVRQLIHQSIPAVEEQVKYRQAFYTVNGKQVCVFFPAKDWVNVTLFNAASLQAPEGTFEPSDHPDRKTIKIKENKELDDAVLESLFKQAAAVQH